MTPSAADRKNEHLLLCLEGDVESTVSAGFEDYRFDHLPFPELSFAQVDTGVSLWQKQLSFPLLIGSLTGGTGRAGKINRILAAAASGAGIGMCLGSLRIAIDDRSTLPTFDVRGACPDLPLLAGNIGAWQLAGDRRNHYIDGTAEIADALQLDAMIVHFNPLQEMIQPGGDRDFRGALAGLAELKERLDVPVAVKEVGCGFSAAAADKLREYEIDGIEVAGRGGTDFAKVEALRSQDRATAGMAQTFDNWGERTADSLVMLRRTFPALPLIASGGVRNGLDLAIAMRLGADAVAMARPFLQAAAEGIEEVKTLIERIKTELSAAMLLTGSPSPIHLKKAPLRKVVKYNEMEVK